MNTWYKNRIFVVHKRL